MDGDYKRVHQCRVCKGKNLSMYLDLGNMPLANGLINKEEISKEKKYPLEVLFCEDCNFSQLSVVVNPELMFKDYVYRSSISKTFSAHCSDLAEELKLDKILGNDDLIVDIASNDGCLLEHFKKNKNKILGVDPAVNLAKIANRRGIETIPEFWDERLSEDILKKYGPAKAITAFNVFAHVDNIDSFVKGAKNLLSKNGYLIIESPHLYNLIQKTEFDTIYHEHLSYLLVTPLIKLMEKNDMRIAKAKKFDIHGGSIRMYVEHKEAIDTSDGSVQNIIEKEKDAGLCDLKTYNILGENVKKLKTDLCSKLTELKEMGKTVSGFGASAKGNTLLNYCGVNNKTVDYIFDDTPEKQGKITPGVHIPIKDGKELCDYQPDYLLLLAWNFVEEIKKRTKTYSERGGKYLLPVPKLEIL